MCYNRNVLRYKNIVEFLGINNNQKNHMKGTIKTLVEAKKFGFISRDGEAKDLFFHSSELNGVTFDELKVGDAVTFEIAQSEKGPAATKVSRA